MASSDELLQRLTSPELLARLTGEVLAELRGEREPIPIGVSARHVHLTREHCDILFGQGYELTVFRELYQPGFYAANEMVTLVSTKRALHNVRILFPLRDASQVEIARSDAFTLGVNPPLRLSGDVKGSAPITLVGPKGSVHLPEGLIIAARHVHMDAAVAKRWDLRSGDSIEVEIDGPRGARLRNVAVRVSEGTLLEMHLDTDEANAADIGQGVFARMVS
ncbi:MAG: phosphate propanoyltransferase [Armatimonadetes bacterium]|nr:phosphate propanoyltransferase [Armatimonadota bacterium]